MTSNPIRNVSDTALWVAIYRAMENERRDAVFRDPYARRLGGERGQAIVDALPSGAQLSWPIVVRTAVMDEIVLRCVRQGAKTVLNLAAGLDARPYRLALPANLRWLHVDMPEMVEYFQDQMGEETPRCQVDFIAADLREADRRREVLALAARRGPVLVITEGLLMYLAPDDVAALAIDLREVAKARWWLSDIVSPMLLKYLERRMLPTLREGNAPFLFAPAESTAFFAPMGWHETEFRSSFEESLRLGRTMRWAWLVRWLSALQPRAQREATRRMSGIFLLEPS
jgi:methyltransferase (TIGR00027 family)